MSRGLKLAGCFSICIIAVATVACSPHTPDDVESIVDDEPSTAMPTENVGDSSAVPGSSGTPDAEEPGGCDPSAIASRDAGAQADGSGLGLPDGGIEVPPGCEVVEFASPAVEARVRELIGVPSEAKPLAGSVLHEDDIVSPVFVTTSLA